MPKKQEMLLNRNIKNSKKVKQKGNKKKRYSSCLVNGVSEKKGKIGLPMK